MRDILDSLHTQGFRRFLVANGHGGNVLSDVPAYDDGEVLWHDVWEGRPDELAAEIDSDFDHASWSENFPWTRLPGVEMPTERKPPVVRPSDDDPQAWRKALGTDRSAARISARPKTRCASGPPRSSSCGGGSHLAGPGDNQRVAGG